MIELPKQIHIGWQTYQLEEMPREQVNEAYGECDTGRGVIRLDTERPNDAVADTLIHECLHAIANSADLKISNEEKVVSVLAHGLIELFKRNHGLTNSLFRLIYTDNA
jgi:hypothetical protein